MRRMRKGREKLVIDHLHLVRFILKRFRFKKNLYKDLDDLLQEGCMGLMEAARKFDFYRGIPFKFFARKYVYGRMIDHLRRGHLIYKSYRKNITPPLEIFSLDLQFEEVEALGDKGGIEPEIRLSLYNAIESLPEKQKFTIIQKYFEGFTDIETAPLLDVGDSRVSQIHTIAMERLRESLNSHG